MALLTRRKFVQSGAAAAATLASGAGAGASSSKPRNVLFIGVDDQNASLGLYGNTVVKTPNLDALARRGTRFSAAYCQFPLCGPSRSSLMTGLSPDTTRVFDLATPFRDNIPDVITLGQLFRKNGYYSARVGKIYHQGVPEDIGTSGQDDPATWDYVYNPDGVDHTEDEPDVTNYTPNRVHRGVTGLMSLGSSIAFYESPSPDSKMTDSLGADEVIRLLKEKRDKPFFLAYGLYRPHVPWIVPKHYFDMYPIEGITPRGYTAAELTMAPKAAYWTQPPNFGMNEMQSRTAIRAYYASSTFMDAQVGRVLNTLKELGLEENTIVVFWADHGWSLGEHGQWMKQTLFEPSARVPMIFAGPGVKRNQNVRRTVEHLNLYPTLADICGLKGAPEALQGVSMKRLLEDGTVTWSVPAVTQVARPSDPKPKTMGYSIRDERYRYTVWLGEDTGEELYDYQIDPHETRNRVVDPELRSVKDRLRSELEQITASRGRHMSFEAEPQAAQPS